jgi:hypothetical protein
MTSRYVLASMAGLAVGAASTGASNALTVMPATLMVAFGVIGAILALAPSGRRMMATALLACGIALGTALPHAAPQPSGAVVTHAVHSSQRGDLFELLDQIDADPHTLLGSRVTISGEWSPASGDQAATVSRRVMSCCAADAVRVGFDVLSSREVRLREGKPVRVDGVLRSRLRDGDVRYVIDDARVEIARCDVPPCASP